MQWSAYAQNHKSCEYVPKSTTMIVNNVRNFAWTDWYFGDLAAFMATSSYVFTAHAYKCLFRRFW